MIAQPSVHSQEAASQATVQIAIVGDVHQQWNDDDAVALQSLGVDLVLFVGDFGNEDLAVVRQIAALPLPKAAIFGNHDAWYTATPWGRRKRPYDPAIDDRFGNQLKTLEACHVGYGCLDFPPLGLSVIGARPFSWGGSDWRNKTFYRDRYNVTSFADSTAKILAAARRATQPNLILIGHNGPKGLGDQPEDICGKDWKPIGGDYGDPDFAEAIAQLRPELTTQGKRLPLISFGHMHHNLRHRKDRRRTSTLHKSGTLYLNAACCPRHRESDAGLQRNFSLATLHDGSITASRLIWLDAHHQIVQEEDLLADISSLEPTVAGR